MHPHFFFFQASGVLLLASGFWIWAKLHKYLELDRDLGQALPLFISGLGGFVVLLASVACGCTVRGTAPKIYIVRDGSFATFGS